MCITQNSLIHIPRHSNIVIMKKPENLTDLLHKREGEDVDIHFTVEKKKRYE